MIKFILVLQNSSKKHNTDYFSAAVSRYCKYICSDNESDFTCFISKTTNNFSEYVNALLDCYKYVESEKADTKGILLALNYQTLNNEIKYIKSENILLLTEVLNNKKHVWKSVGELKTLIKESMDWYFFNLAYDNFRHGQKNDIVNSELGLLKVYLDNPETTALTNNIIHSDIINKVIALLKKLRDSINNYYSVADLKAYNTKISDNLEYTNYIIDNLIEVLNSYDIETLIIDDKISHNVSLDIFELFCRISYYKEFTHE